MGTNAGQITQLLHRWRDGSPGVEDELFEIVKPQLDQLAHRLMRGERKGISLQSSDLVGQMYLALVAAKDRDWQNRQHFVRFTAKAMRNYLISKSRSRRSFVPLDDVKSVLPGKRSTVELAVAVDRLLDDLQKHDPELSTVVELKFFLSLTDEEAAETLGWKLRTFQRKWHDARRWLFEKFEADDVAIGRRSRNETGPGDDGEA